MREFGRWLCAGMVLGAILLTLPAIASGGAADGRLDIHWIDVEGGAATLIVTPAGQSVLIDTGNPGFRDAQRIVRTAAAAGLRRIDYLIITHYHGDHFGGAAALSRQIPIGTVHDNGVFEGMPNDPGREYFSFPCEKREVIQPGTRIELRAADRDDSPAVELVCLGTRQKFIQPAEGTPDNAAVCADARMKDRDGSDNANSVVMLLRFGPFRFFDAGDLTWNREHDLVCPRNLVGEVDVYQVTHHGLDSSNNPLVLRSLRPTVAVMNNGHVKGCLPEVFATIAETPSIEALYQVHKNLRPDGAMNNAPDEYIANHLNDQNCQGNTIHLSVDPQGLTYAVSIPANGHQRTFQTRVR